jgi:hypothetical protein
VKRSQRPFSRELAELVRYAVGYWSRAYVTFGKPIPTAGIDPDSRRAVLDVSHAVMREIGRIYKVLPTAVIASAMQPSITRRELEQRADRLLDALRAANANLGVSTGAHAIEAALEPLESRGILVVNRGRIRVRNRNVLRYYARSIDHLLDSRPRHKH